MVAFVVALPDDTVLLLEIVVLLLEIVVLLPDTEVFPPLLTALFPNPKSPRTELTKPRF